LQFGLPFVEDGSFDGAYREASATIDAEAVIDEGVLGPFGIGLAFCPLDALDGAYGHAVGETFADICNDCISHKANSLLFLATVQIRLRGQFEDLGRQT
jgi:hypothetical protein